MPLLLQLAEFDFQLQFKQIDRLLGRPFKNLRYSNEYRSILTFDRLNHASSGRYRYLTIGEHVELLFDLLGISALR